MPDPSPQSAIPAAAVQPQAAWTSRVAWLIPLAALGFAGVLVVNYVRQAGPIITLTFDNGHGLRVGDALRCQGIDVGRVEAVRLSDDAQSVTVEARLEPDAAMLARSGTRFWIVHPQVSFEGVTGLETIAGPRYIAVLPGGGERQGAFVGLSEPPVMATEPPGGLEVILDAERRGSLRPGVPIMYRQTRIGTVIAVGLASDATSVEVRAYIRPGFTTLVRHNSVFWNASGADFKASLTEGFKLQVESVQALLAGGVSMATPNEAGGPVSTGHRFPLAESAESDWKKWRPAIALGSALLPPGLTPPTALPAVTQRSPAGLFSRAKQRRGWVLALPGGLIGPADLLEPTAADDKAPAVLEVAGSRITLDQTPRWQAHGLLLLPMDPPAAPWPLDRIRRPESPEDCLIFTDAAASPIALAVARLRAAEGGEQWAVDRSVAPDDTWHGAPVLARSDGKLVGMLLVGSDASATVVLLPTRFPEPTPPAGN